MPKDPQLRALAILMALALAPVPAGAQARVVARVTTAPAKVTPARQMKDALRQMVTTQGAYHAEHARYATDATELELDADHSVRLELLGATPDGWAARATHTARPGRSCVVFGGTPPGMQSPVTDADQLVAGEAGVPLCDRTE